MALAKALWAVTMDEDALLNDARACGAYAVCVRTTNDDLPSAIERFHQAGLLVYAWRWPAVRPSHGPPHHYAMDEAAYVAERLIPRGLDGYIIDPEGESDRDADNWNDRSLGELATAFCQAIRGAAREKGRDDFLFGLTSGHHYPRAKPRIPWAEFVAESDVLFPQTYWNGSGGRVHGGTPQESLQTSLPSWQAIANGKPLIPIGGQLSHVTPEEIAAYGEEADTHGFDTVHLYAHRRPLSPEMIAAIAAL